MKEITKKCVGCDKKLNTYIKIDLCYDCFRKIEAVNFLRYSSDLTYK